MNVGSGDIVPTGFPEKKTGRPSGVLMGAPPKRLFAPFGTAGSERVLHAEKGCGRAFDGLFGRIAFFMRGRPAIPVFSGLACGPPPFLATRKGEKNRQGALSIFSL